MILQVISGITLIFIFYVGYEIMYEPSQIFRDMANGTSTIFNSSALDYYNQTGQTQATTEYQNAISTIWWIWNSMPMLFVAVIFIILIVAVLLKEPDSGVR